MKSLGYVIDNLKSIADNTESLRFFGAIVIILIGLQILNRFRFHPQLNILTRTIANALKQFGAFFVVFIVIFTTFTIIGSITFGDRAKEFSSLENSMASCINMLLGQFDFESIKTFQYSVPFYWAYMIVVSIVLMNMMLAIVLDAYEQVSSDSYKKSANLALANRVISVCWDVVCEIFVVMLSRRSVVSRGKIRPRRLEWALQQKLLERPHTVLTPEMMKSLFPDTNLSYAEFKATLQHIEQGIVIVDALKSGDTGSKGE